MKNITVRVPSVRNLITPSPGFAKKRLSDFKLDLSALCGFGCAYCSSNCGNYLRIRREEFAALAEQQTGERMYPADRPDLALMWDNPVEQLERELAKKRPDFGAGSTLQFGMLTDNFSPLLVKDGTTEAALRLVLEMTGFRIRVLTKNAAVGQKKWVDLFAAHPGRFVVGLSTGTMDDDWAKRVEKGTSVPSARFRALRSLQEAGIPTFGMLCPVFPDVLEGGGLERLVDRINPAVAEDVWAEPYNDRANWERVRDSYAVGSPGYGWFQDVYGDRRKDAWSNYATVLYLRLKALAERDGWLHKVRFLLYEDQITEADAMRLADLSGVLLQSKPQPDGLSQNPHIAQLQQRTCFREPRKPERDDGPAGQADDRSQPILPRLQWPHCTSSISILA